MKTRIKIIEKRNGEKTYHIQIKGFIFPWYIYIIPLFGWIGIIMGFYWEDIYSTYDRHENEYDNLEDAKKAIDTYYHNLEVEELRVNGDKIISKKYIKYP